MEFLPLGFKNAISHFPFTLIEKNVKQAQAHKWKGVVRGDNGFVTTLSAMTLDCSKSDYKTR